MTVTEVFISFIKSIIILGLLFIGPILTVYGAESSTTKIVPSNGIDTLVILSPEELESDKILRRNCLIAGIVFLVLDVILGTFYFY